MKNLFDLATKEFTQDAFLRWMFENYGNLQIARDLLKNFCEFADDEEIKDLKTVAQWNKVDVAVFITTNARKIGLFIEDKTFTGEHDNQLKKYDAHIRAQKKKDGLDVYKIYYKTNAVSDAEKERISANADEETGEWRICDIFELYAFFAKYKNSRNIIIAQYVEHIETINQAVKNTVKPQINDSDKINLLKWEAYFKSVIGKLTGKDKEYTCGAWQAGHYPYICLNIEKIGEGRKPYLEVTSADCAGDKFKAKIKMHNSPSEEEKAKADEYRAEYFNGKTYDGWQIQKNKRQYACSKEEQARTDEEFLDLLNKYIKSYLQIMENWE